MRKLRPSLLALAVAIPGALAAAGPAHAALPWVPCAQATFQCTTYDVPVDRSGAVKGTIKLSARRALAASGDGSTAVVALAGGPGQAAQPIASGFKAVLAPLLGTRDLLVYDQRGTGLSNPLTCAGLSSAGTLTSRVSKCAGQIGPARAFFTTADSVADIEALRVAAGYSKLVLYGVSYGTKVALAYAAAHPSTTAALVLDSVVPPEGPDALRRATLAAIPRALGDDLCGGSECKGITTSVVADVRKLASKLGTHPLTGPVLDGHGRSFRARLSVDGLLGILIAGDLDPTLRAELPGSLRAALTGDVKPILRLSARSAGLENAARGFQQAAADNDPLFFTTLCEENTTLPWTRGGTLAARVKEAEARVKALPASAFGPFPRSVALGGIPSLCVGWPVASAAPPAPGALPDVPVLVLDGLSDLRTPVEDAKAVAARFPHAQVVAVPHSGHSVLGTEPGTCAKSALAAFAAGGAVQPCPAVENPYSPTPRPPLSLAKVKPAGGFSPKIGRTINAVTATLTDARRQVIGRALGSGRLPSAVGGLRRGWVRVTSFTNLGLRGYEYVPGVRVTGSYRSTGTTTVLISGSSAAHGRLTFSNGGDTLKGILDGRKVSASRTRASTRAAGPGGLPTLAQAVAQGRIAAAGR